MLCVADATAAGRVTVDDERPPVVIRIYERRAMRISCQRIGMELTADRIPSPAGAATWGPTQVRRINQDRTYLGEGTWGTHGNVGTEGGTVVHHRTRAESGTIPLR